MPNSVQETTILEYPIVGAKEGEPEMWPLVKSTVDRWINSYPGLDVLAECRKALEWVFAKPANRKTSRGMQTFLVSWLNRATNSARPAQTIPFGGKPQAETMEQKARRIQAEVREMQKRKDDRNE